MANARGLNPATKENPDTTANPADAAVSRRMSFVIECKFHPWRTLIGIAGSFATRRNTIAEEHSGGRGLERRTRGDKTARRRGNWLFRPRRDQKNYVRELRTGLSVSRKSHWHSSQGKKRDRGLPAVAISAAAAATTTTTAAATTISTTASATTAARASAGASLVDLNPAALQIGVIEGLDCGGRVGRLDHLDEPETPRLPRELVRHYDRAFHLTGLPKQLRQVLLSNRVGEIAYIQLSGHNSSAPSEFAGQLLSSRSCGNEGGIYEKRLRR